MPIIPLDGDKADEFGLSGKKEIIELDGFTYQLHEKTDETNELKLVLWTAIYKRNDGKFFAQHNSKSGSWNSGYEFEYGDELHEVKPVQVTTTEWKEV